ncbi:MAG TPA: hypothetical protein VID27_06260 [Blastocatellia bacterium]|jgi:hypothetical protein
MAMKFLRIILIVLLITSSIATGQTANQQSAATGCNLTETTAPAIRGIRLGMTAEQLLALFPGSSEKAAIKRALEEAKSPKSYDIGRLYFQISEYAEKDRFAGVDYVSVVTYKDRVTEFTVLYNGPNSDGPYWRHIDEWIAKLSEAFGLPGAAYWEGGTLKCSGIEIIADIQSGAGKISLRNPAYHKEVRDHAKAYEEKKRREFKP